MIQLFFKQGINMSTAVIAIALVYIVYSIRSSIKKTKYFNKIENDENSSLERRNETFAMDLYGLFSGIVLSLVVVFYNQDFVKGFIIFLVISIIFFAISRKANGLMKDFLFVEKRDYPGKSIDINDKRKSLVMGLFGIIMIIFCTYTLFYSVFIHTLLFENLITDNFLESTNIEMAKKMGVLGSIYLSVNLIKYLMPMKALFKSCLRTMEKQ